MQRWPAFLVLLLLSVACAAAQPVRLAEAVGAPVVLPEAVQYDFVSKINGRAYRIMVAMPYEADARVAYPVLYVLDGNAYFGTATTAMRRQSFSSTAVPAVVAKSIIVGVGYPSNDMQDINRRRSFDLTPTVAKDKGYADPTGGGDDFIRVLLEEVKPFVTARYHPDPERQVLWGHSLGGLLTLRMLFRHPDAFSGYVLSSPSIWWNDRDILADEPAFAKRVRSGEVKARVLIVSAGDEQYVGDNPARLAEARTNRMVENASELAGRLTLLNPRNLVVTRTVFPGETHITVPPASLSRSLRFAFPDSPEDRE